DLTAVPPVGMTILGSSAVPTYSSKSLREYSLRVRVRCLDRHLAQIVGTALGVGLCWRGAARWHARTLFRRQQRHQDVTFHAGHRFDLAMLTDFAQEPGHLGASHFLVSHFTATMKNHGANFVA